MQAEGTRLPAMLPMAPQCQLPLALPTSARLVAALNECLYQAAAQVGRDKCGGKLSAGEPRCNLKDIIQHPGLKYNDGASARSLSSSVRASHAACGTGGDACCAQPLHGPPRPPNPAPLVRLTP